MTQFRASPALPSTTPSFLCEAIICSKNLHARSLGFPPLPKSQARRPSDSRARDAYFFFLASPFVPNQCESVDTPRGPS